ncbi:MAG: signal transduction histidine kinase/CheY-like chemotaxis protein [Glaciecola sp.]|jgi:signal transduction histidine kinase/CheY-like chemotaxis protein
MSLSSNLAQRRLIEKYTKTGSFKHNYHNQTSVWSDSLVTLLDLQAIKHIPCQEWEIPSLSEPAQQIIKNRINISENKRIPIDVLLPSFNTANETNVFRYCCEFVETDDGLSRIGFFQKLSSNSEPQKSNDHQPNQQDRIQMALNASKAGTWEYLTVSNELYWDEAMYALFDVPKSGQVLQFSDWLKLIEASQQDKFIKSFDVVNRLPANDEWIDKTFRFRSSLGKQKFIQLTARFYRNELDKIVRVMGTCQDVTELELCKQALLEQASLVQKHEMMVEDANAARARFIANVSHELRTPLNSIMGALQILESFNFNDEIQSILQMANTSSNELLSTVNDVLDLSKADSQKMNIEKIDIDIPQLIENAVAKHHPLLNKGTELIVDIANGFKNNRLGDPIRFNQIVNNLISNAVKFTSHGQVLVSLSGDKNNIEVRVKDTGIGISPEDTKLIFEAFRQTDESTTRQFGGAGLGLAISTKLAELMGGNIELNSKIGIGSEFRLSLPMPVIGEHVVNLGGNQLSDTVPDLSHQHILYAEDNEKNVKTIQQLLRPTKAILDFAIDGKQALALYRKKKSITMIILDLQLPFIDGLQVCEKIRYENKTIPIIALVTEMTKEDKKSYFNAGFTDIIEKPIMFDSFYDVLASI